MTTEHWVNQYFLLTAEELVDFEELLERKTGGRFARDAYRGDREELEEKVHHALGRRWHHYVLNLQDIWRFELAHGQPLDFGNQRDDPASWDASIASLYPLLVRRPKNSPVLEIDLDSAAQDPVPLSVLALLSNGGLKSRKSNGFLSVLSGKFAVDPLQALAKQLGNRKRDFVEDPLMTEENVHARYFRVPVVDDVISPEWTRRLFFSGDMHAGYRPNFFDDVVAYKQKTNPPKPAFSAATHLCRRFDTYNDGKWHFLYPLATNYQPLVYLAESLDEWPIARFAVKTSGRASLETSFIRYAREPFATDSVTLIGKSRLPLFLRREWGMRYANEK